MDYIRMLHPGPGWLTGKWIVIISQLEQQRHTQAHRLLSDQLAVGLALADILGSGMAMSSTVQFNNFRCCYLDSEWQIKRCHLNVESIKTSENYQVKHMLIHTIRFHVKPVKRHQQTSLNLKVQVKQRPFNQYISALLWTVLSNHS